jgi:hypothetical protein
MPMNASLRHLPTVGHAWQAAFANDVHSSDLLDPTAPIEGWSTCLPCVDGTPKGNLVASGPRKPAHCRAGTAALVYVCLVLTC